MKEGDIPVTKPFLPPLEEFQPYLREIWDSYQLTNNGRFLRMLEEKLTGFLGIPQITVTSNGTVSLLMALKALGVEGEVITTPFSFPATTHAIWWNGNTPVFADIEPQYLNIDPERLEAAITGHTAAILVTHVYGNPCDIEQIDKISKKYSIPVIYDACHAFGINFRNESLLNAGDLSVLSFHPTKVFTTVEGGAIISHTPEMSETLRLLRNFGIAGEESVLIPGINGKMNELQAAFGLLQLNYFADLTSRRKEIYERYLDHFSGVPGIRIIGKHPEIDYNYAYFPVLFNHEAFGRSRDQVYTHLRDNHILSRKYFAPLISHIPWYSKLPSAEPSRLPVAEKASGEILCLPIYPDLEISMVDRICELICGHL
jgi:dTDP-4-amino-4,6-dideoxygalactose transaminase